MRTALGEIAPRCVWVVAVWCGACSEAEVLEKRPNIVLISLDTLRADRLSCYGHGRETSPRIDALAREGVLCEGAVSTSSWTLPSHWSMLTGLPVSVHGVCDEQLWNRRAEEGEVVLPSRGRFLGEELVEAGYATAGFYSWLYLDPKFGLGPGFETYERLGLFGYDHPRIKARADAARELEDPAEQVAVGRALQAEYPELFDIGRPTASEVVDRSLEWLREQVAEGDGQPVFLFMHLFDAHDPYTPPEPFASMFGAGYEGPIDGREVTGEASLVQPGMAPEDLDHLLALYDGGVAWVDSEVGRFLDGLEALGLSEETLVIVTADHGEEFFEHGRKTHRKQLHAESVRVPLVMRWPGRLPAGARISGPTGIVDVAPTILRAAGLRALEASPGVDLVSLARGSREGSGVYLTELTTFEAGPVPVRRVGLWTRERHYLLRGQRGGEPWVVEFFELGGDGVGAGEGQLVVEGEAEYSRAVGLLEEVRAECVGRRGLAPSRSEVMEPLSEEDRRLLGALGYVEGDHALSGADVGRICLDGCVWPGG
jgi:arylsulfatase A-like enzyme